MIATTKYRVPAFLAFWTAVVAVSVVVTRVNQFAIHADLLSAAVTLDLVVLVPVVYLLVARRMGWRLLLAIPILVLMLITANILIPAKHQGVLNILELMLAPIELMILVFVVRKVRAVRKEHKSAGAPAEDFYETLEEVLTRTVDPGRPAKLIATEIAMIFYGLFAWRRKPDDRADRQIFTYHRSSGHGTVMGVFLFLVPLEAGALHWYLLPRVPVLAWILFGISIYSMVFLLADLNAARLRPIYIEDGELVVRVALRWRVRIPLSEIEKVETTTHDIEDRDGLLAAPLVGNQNVVLHLRRPFTASGLYGFEKEFVRISLEVDDLPAFVNALDGTSNEPDLANGSATAVEIDRSTAVGNDGDRGGSA